MNISNKLSLPSLSKLKFKGQDLDLEQKTKLLKGKVRSNSKIIMSGRLNNWNKGYSDVYVEKWKIRNSSVIKKYN